MRHTSGQPPFLTTTWTLDKSHRPRSEALLAYLIKPRHSHTRKREANGPQTSALVRRCLPAFATQLDTYPASPAYFLRRLLARFFSSAWPRFVHSPWCPVATRRTFRRLVAAAASVRRPTALPLLPLTHGPTPFRWSALRPGIQPRTPCPDKAGRMASAIRRSGRTRVSTSGALSEVHTFQLCWCLVGGYVQHCSPGS